MEYVYYMRNVFEAACDGQEQEVKVWIELSKRTPLSFIDRLDKAGYSPLHYATKFNHYSVLDTLIEAGASE